MLSAHMHTGRLCELCKIYLVSKLLKPIYTHTHTLSLKAISLWRILIKVKGVFKSGGGEI